MSQYIRIETTNACNLRCNFCPQSLDAPAKHRGMMDPALFAKIVAEVSPFQENLNAPFYLHICGEPLLHPRIERLIAIAADAGLRPMLTTNATLLKPELAERLVRSGLSGIEFSFEGADKASYESLRKGASYEAVRRNIEGFLRANDAAGHPVHTELVVVDAPSIPPKRLRDFCTEMEPFFDKVNLSGYFDWLGSMETIEYERTNYVGCPAPDIDLNVLWDGRVIPCCMDVDGAMTIGDFRTMTYLEILASPQRRSLRERLAKGDLRGLLCEKCATPWGGRAVRSDATAPISKKATP